MTEPLHFCRYRSLSGSNAKWVGDSILRSKHYFARPLSFNDPFDCRPNFGLQGTKGQLLKYFEGILARRAPELGREARRAEARRRLTDPEFDPRQPNNVEGFRRAYHETVTARVGILCLSEKNDDILMWAHYADAHRGVCLVLDATKPFFATAQPVRYKTTRPSVNPLVHTHDEMLDNAMFTKSDHWSYEAEWRILQYKNGAGVYTVPSASLKEVILGAQISDTDEKQMRSWVKQCVTPIVLRKAYLSPTAFALEIRDANF